MLTARRFAFRTMSRLVLPALLLLARPTATPAVNAAPEVTGPIAASMFPEVRLRKLHLVRPDLIFYPVQYEVYC